MLMTTCFVCATLNLGRKKSTGTEPEKFVRIESKPRYPVSKLKYSRN